MPSLVIVAGPNGSGKTTLVESGILAAILGVPETSLNADQIARELAGDGQPTDAQSLLAAQATDHRLDREIAAAGR